MGILRWLRNKRIEELEVNLGFVKVKIRDKAGSNATAREDENRSLKVTTSEDRKEAVLELRTVIPDWIVENVGDWSRKELILQIFLTKGNQAMNIDEVEMDGRNLGVDMKSWISHNFKRDLGGDVLEVERGGTSKVYKLSAVGLAKAKAFRSKYVG